MYDDGDYDEREKSKKRIMEGYECRECGYTPTQFELNKGTCPNCFKYRMALIEKEKANGN